MASIAMLIGGALANAQAFTSRSSLFSRLSKDSIDAEAKRHDAEIQQLQKAKNDKSESILSIDNKGCKQQRKQNSQS